MRITDISKIILAAIAAATLTVSCSDDSTTDGDALLGTLTPADRPFGVANDVFSADEWYPGGQLGTTVKTSYSAAAPAVENTAGMEESFNKGEDFFEHLYTITENPRKGLGPAWTRNSCIHCHPGYGHGKRQTEYRANTVGNGYLLVVYHPTAGVDADARHTRPTPMCATSRACRRHRPCTRSRRPSTRAGSVLSGRMSRPCPAACP